MKTKPFNFTNQFNTNDPKFKAGIEQLKQILEKQKVVSKKEPTQKKTIKALLQEAHQKSLRRQKEESIKPIEELIDFILHILGIGFLINFGKKEDQEKLLEDLLNQHMGEEESSQISYDGENPSAAVSEGMLDGNTIDEYKLDDNGEVKDASISEFLREKVSDVFSGLKESLGLGENPLNQGKASEELSEAGVDVVSELAMKDKVTLNNNPNLMHSAGQVIRLMLEKSSTKRSQVLQNLIKSVSEKGINFSEVLGVAKGLKSSIFNALIAKKAQAKKQQQDKTQANKLSM
ncbi:hypothetical protein ACQ1Q5_00370 [Ornithobacterium rhinotracheale]